MPRSGSCRSRFRRFINDVPIPTEEIPTHQGTDLAYLKKLASDHGYVFYVEPGPLPGQSIAYWGPTSAFRCRSRRSTSTWTRTPTSSRSASAWTAWRRRSWSSTIIDPVTGKIPIPLPMPNINLFKPPLGAATDAAGQVEFPDWRKEKTPQHHRQDPGCSGASSDAISVSGSLDVLRYGRVLRSRMLVGVRGAGLAYDGLYYVNSVTHNIKRGEYKQSFQLSRDGLISNTPRYPYERGQARASGSMASTGARWCRMSTRELRGRLMCMVPDVLGLVPSSWCEAVRAAGGADRSADGRLHGAADRRGRVGGVRAGRSQQADLDAAAAGAAQSDMPPLALAGNPADPEHLIQSLLQHSIMISDMPPSAAHRRNHPEEHDRSDDRRQRHRHLHQQRQGRDDHDDRPDHRPQHRRADIV